MKNYSCNKWLILVIFLAALTILCCQSAYCSQPCIAMDLNASFGGSYDDELYSIQRTSDAGYIATGRTKSYGDNNYDLFLNEYPAACCGWDGQETDLRKGAYSMLDD